MTRRNKLRSDEVDWHPTTPLGRAIKRGEVCGACTITVTGKRYEELSRCKNIGRVYARADGTVIAIVRCPFAPSNPTMVVPAHLMDGLGNVDLKRYAAAAAGLVYDPRPSEEDEDR